ncbi:MAG TPA: hypothetical protein VMU92_00595 [Acidobacteriaceae bacterium]|nr:hypothetical protein [Acidobacteriaceae bacterium]
MAEEIVEDRGVEDGGGVELFSGDGRADDGKNAGADDGSDAERGERDRPECFAEPVLGFFRLGDELVDGFTAKGLAWQSPAPLERCDEGSLPGMRPTLRVKTSRVGFVQWELALALAAAELFDLLLVGATGSSAGCLGCGLFARSAFYFFAFYLVFNRLCVCHSYPYLSISISESVVERTCGLEPLELGEFLNQFFHAEL